jgi:hypothetical protein
MTALGIGLTDRDVDKFYWTAPSTYGKPLDLLEVESELYKLESRFIRLTDVEPLPWAELEETEDQIKQLEVRRVSIWNKWQATIHDQRKEMVRQ